MNPVTQQQMPKKRANDKKGKVEEGDVMAEKKQQLQDIFLNQIRKEKVAITVFLMNGVKLQGVVTWFDSFSILLKRDNVAQLVYKHAISTIMPAHPIQLYDGADADKDAKKASKKE